MALKFNLSEIAQVPRRARPEQGAGHNLEEAQGIRNYIAERITELEEKADEGDAHPWIKPYYGKWRLTVPVGSMTVFWGFEDGERKGKSEIITETMDEGRAILLDIAENASDDALNAVWERAAKAYTQSLAANKKITAKAKEDYEASNGAGSWDRTVPEGKDGNPIFANRKVRPGAIAKAKRDLDLNSNNFYYDDIEAL